MKLYGMMKVYGMCYSTILGLCPQKSIYEHSDVVHQDFVGRVCFDHLQQTPKLQRKDLLFYSSLFDFVDFFISRASQHT